MILKRLLTIMILILSIVAFTACESKGPAEKAGEKIDQAVEKTTDKAEVVTEAVKEKAE
jgi:hyperosmotically inducible protein